MFDADIINKATHLLERARQHEAMIATAESCTGGLISGALTEIAGSSDVVDRGFVTYTNAAKMAMLGVTRIALENHGAVSEPVARAMALGALVQSDAHLAVAVTGIAGPGGGSSEKPVGLVHLAAASRIKGTSPNVIHREARFGDLGRSNVRLETVRTALELLHELIDQTESSLNS